MGDDFKARLQDEITTAYEASGNSLGWRLLCSPDHVLDGARVAFIGLNPGGSVIDRNHAEFAMIKGSAYRDEKWPASSKLQNEVLALFRMLNVRPEDVLAGNLVPFRSRNWSSLNGKQAALAFGSMIWTRILQRASPEIVVSMGSEANLAVSSLLEVGNIVRHELGWGDYKASRGIHKNGVWVGLPHLSRFTIMTRPASRTALQGLFSDMRGT